MNTLRRSFLLAASGAVAARPVRAAGWIPLFDGQTLKGWKIEGKARWSVEDGALVGRQGPAGEAGDLFTVERWADFEFEGEWRMRWPGNSGLWFRYAGPKTGYQADFLDQPSHPGVLSGSLYCMGKAFIAENRNAASVRKNDWNRLRIRVQGDRIQIAMNGIDVIDKRDTTWPGAGSIGVQIHAGKQFEGMEVRLRGMRLKPL